MSRDHPSVRVITPTGDFDRHVTNVTSNRSYSATAPGGYSPAQFDLNRALLDVDIPPLSRVIMSDPATAEILHDSYTTSPGRTFGDDGERWQVDTAGPDSLARDEASAYIVIDTSFEGWQTRALNPPSATASAGSHPDTDEDALMFQFAEGQAIGANSRAPMEYAPIAAAGQTLGGFRYTYVCGTGVVGYKLEVRVSPSAVTARTDAMSLTPVVRADAADGIPNYTGDTSYVLRLVRDGPATTPSANIWAAVTEIMVRASLLDRFGASTYQSSDHVYAHEVWIDAVTRFVPGYDIANAQIAAFTHEIQQLAYMDPVRATDVFDDLMVTEPSSCWAAWERGTYGHRFEVFTWDETRPRFILDGDDGMSLSGGDVELCNRVRVTYEDKRGRAMSVVVTSTVPALDAVGRIRWADALELGAEAGTAAEAQWVGEQWLASRNQPRLAGTVTIKTPLLDVLTGRVWEPWELPSVAAGQTALVAPMGLEYPTPLRITEVGYADDDGTATLTLGSPEVRTAEELLAETQTRRSRRTSVLTRR